MSYDRTAIPPPEPLVGPAVRVPRVPADARAPFEDLLDLLDTLEAVCPQAFEYRPQRSPLNPERCKL